MPRSRSWQTVPVDQRVREAGGWLGPFGAPTEQEPDMAGAFTALRRMNDVAFETARDDERYGETLTDVPGLYGPTTGFQTVERPHIPAPTSSADPHGVHPAEQPDVPAPSSRARREPSH